jgi:hypothetical protein
VRQQEGEDMVRGTRQEMPMGQQEGLDTIRGFGEENELWQQGRVTMIRGFQQEHEVWHQEGEDMSRDPGKENEVRRRERDELRHALEERCAALIAAQDKCNQLQDQGESLKAERDCLSPGAGGLAGKDGEMGSSGRRWGFVKLLCCLVLPPTLH